MGVEAVLGGQLLPAIRPQLVHYDLQRGGDVTDRQNQVYDGQEGYLPFFTLWILGQSVQYVGVIQLEEITSEQEGQQKGNPLPHPGHEALHCDVHFMTLTQGSEPVQRPLLVEKLNNVKET